jgi:hypothetical protein
MYETTLIIHIILGILTLVTTLVALVYAKTANARKYLYVLIGGLSFQVLSGTYMALISQTVTAFSLCQNLAIYSAVVGVGCFVMSLRSQGLSLKNYMYISAPAVAAYSLFALAIIKKI